MTDNEIIKILECCANADCKRCPCNIDNHHCKDIGSQEILDLINRQKAEIERLEGYNANLEFANQDILYTLETEIKKAKSEAIREFAEKLIERNEDFCVDKSDMAFVVDSIVKEMKEGENG